MRMGSTIRVRAVGGLVWHYGTYIGRWRQHGHAVVHNCKATGVIISSFLDFTEGREYEIFAEPPPGFEEVVAQRALAQVGRRYDLVLFNCEHAANLAANGQHRSDQLRTAAALGVFGLALKLLHDLGSSGDHYDSSVDRYRDSAGRFVSG